MEIGSGLVLFSEAACDGSDPGASRAYKSNFSKLLN